MSRGRAGGDVGEAERREIHVAHQVPTLNWWVGELLEIKTEGKCEEVLWNMEPLFNLDTNWKVQCPDQ